MKQIIFLTVLWAFTLTVNAQTHVRKAIDYILEGHPEWITNYGRNETVNTNLSKSGIQTNRIYQLSITDSTAIDSLVAAFDMDKMDGYGYIRTSAAYNQAMQKNSRVTVTLQNGDRLESHSTQYSFVSLLVVDTDNITFRTNYILKWYPSKDGQTKAKLYILYGPRPNNK